MSYLSDEERSALTFWGQQVNAQIRGFTVDPANDILVMNVRQSNETWVEHQIPLVDAIRIGELVKEWEGRHERLIREMQAVPSTSDIKEAQTKRYDEIRRKIEKANHEGNEEREGYLRSHIPPCEVCDGDHPTYFCCDICNHDGHRCHFCGEHLGHQNKGHCNPEDNQGA